MIISASRRTDIPAYFGEKFYKDLTLGKFEIINPFNNKKTLLNFKKQDIDGIVFWTKNPFPFFKILEKIKSDGYKFYFQYTLNNYPKDVEPLIYDFNERIEHLKILHNISFPNKIFIRYDPIILNKRFNINFHIENFEMLVEQVKNYTERITVSFVTIYRKIKKFFPDIIKDENAEKTLLKKFSNVALKNRLKLYICCYEKNLDSINILSGKCIDASVFGLKNVKKHYGQRKLCNCDKSIDIGYYRTCKTNCVYCYAS